MVSVQQQQQSQYITDFNSPLSTSMDKSPLAMLEKTCETIGLPEAPSKKSSPKSKDTSPTTIPVKGEPIVTKSPRLNQISHVDKKVVSGCEPSTSITPNMYQMNQMMRCVPFPGGMPGPMMPPGMMPFPGNMMSPYMMPFMGNPFGAIPPPPHPNGRPCNVPGCQACALYMAQLGQTANPDLMAQFCMYSNYMNQAAAVSSAASMMPPPMNKNVCVFHNCGKLFNTESDLFEHLKTHVPEYSQQQQQQQNGKPSTPTVDDKKSAKLASPKTQQQQQQNRFHPYGMKDRSITPSMMPPMPQMPSVPTSPNSAAMMQTLMALGMMPPPPMGMPGPFPNFGPYAAMMAAQPRNGTH